MSGEVPDIIPVDNAAQIFVAINSKKETTISRIAVTLKEEINRERMNRALARIIERFPFFRVHIKKEFLDFVFKRTDEVPAVKDDTWWTNRYVDFKAGNFPFTIKASGRTLAVEMSHIISDGFGTLSLLLSLLAEYFRLEGKNIGESDLIKRPGEQIPEEEWKCAFRENFTREGPPQKVQRAAYIPDGKMIPVEKYYSTRIIMDLEEVRKKSRSEHVTLNVFISSIYAFAIQKLYKEDIEAGKVSGDLPVRLQVPVNLRRYFPTSCLRNFSYIYSPFFYIKDGEKSLKEIIHILSSHIRHERHSGSVEAQISRNLRAESFFFFKYMPRPIKQILFKLFYHLFARSQFSGVLTNLGDIVLPPELDEEIESFDVLPCNSPVPGRNTSLFSFRGKLEMSIGSSCEDLRLEERILEILEEQDIDFSVIYKRD